MQRLRQANATINMTESGDPNENAMAERVLRSLKDTCKLAHGFLLFQQQQKRLKGRSMRTTRSDLMYGRTTCPPHQMHHGKRKSKLRWYPNKNVRYGNGPYEATVARPYLGSFNRCPTQSVAYGSRETIKYGQTTYLYFRTINCF